MFFSPDELGVVVRFLGEELGFPPVQELVERGEGILRHGTLIGVAPHLQAHQGHPDVQGPVELQGDFRLDLKTSLSDVTIFLTLLLIGCAL